MAWVRYLTYGVIAVVVVLAMTWEPSRAMSSRIGVFLIVVAFTSLIALPFRRPNPTSAAPGNPVWPAVLSSIGLVLMGIEGVWPQYRVSMIGAAIIIAPSLPDMIRRYSS